MSDFQAHVQDHQSDREEYLLCPLCRKVVITPSDATFNTFNPEGQGNDWFPCCETCTKDPRTWLGSK